MTVAAEERPEVEDRGIPIGLLVAWHRGEAEVVDKKSQDLQEEILADPEAAEADRNTQFRLGQVAGVRATLDGLAAMVMTTVALDRESEGIVTFTQPTPRQDATEDPAA